MHTDTEYRQQNFWLFANQHKPIRFCNDTEIKSRLIKSNSPIETWTIQLYIIDAENKERDKDRVQDSRTSNKTVRDRQVCTQNSDRSPDEWLNIKVETARISRSAPVRNQSPLIKLHCYKFLQLQFWLHSFNNPEINI